MEQMQAILEYEKVRRFILSCVLSVFLAAEAVGAPRFEADVSVDITAATVAEAKKQAMAKAMRDGINEVALNISTGKSVAALDQLNDNQLQHFISGVMVLMEKSSDVRYIADLRISVNEDVLKAYLAENDLPLVVGEEQDVLVIPLLEKADGTLDLWSDGNFWRQAFSERRDVKKGNLNIHNIEKNLGNITAVETNKMYDMTDDEYHELAAFNKVEDIYVLKYSLQDGKVYVKAFPGREANETAIEAATPDEMIDRILPFFKDIKKEVRVEQDKVADEKLEVVYTYPRLGEWTRLKRLLEGNPQVQDISIVSMINGKVHFNFQFGGVVEKLQANLEMNGYKLRKEGEYYVIY